jgi:hypothetical protein
LFKILIIKKRSVMEKALKCLPAGKGRCGLPTGEAGARKV